MNRKRVSKIIEDTKKNYSSYNSITLTSLRVKMSCQQNCNDNRIACILICLHYPIYPRAIIISYMV